MAVNQALFVAIPAAALLINLYLLLICISARKTKVVRAFMLLILAFSAWTGGSAAMRALLYPGYRFWYDVSMAGIFAAPFMMYYFTHHFTGQRARLPLLLLGGLWLVLTILALNDVFILSPAVTAGGETSEFRFGVSYWVAMPLAAGLYTLFLCWRLIRRAVKEKGMPVSSVRPLYYGSILMFLGLASSAVPGLGSFPVDPLACGINALFVFYALHRKHLITFRMVLGHGPLYLAAALLTTITLAVVYPAIDRLYRLYFPEYLAQQTIVIAVLVSLLTVLVYNIIRKLLNSLFARGMNARDEELRRFSREINESLDSQQILQTFGHFIERNIDCDAAYICVRDENNTFVTRASTKPTVVETLSLPGNSPLIEWLQEHNLAISMPDFVRTQHYRSMWESEKELLDSRNIRLALPVMEGGRLMAVTLFADEDSRKAYSSADIVFLEAASAVMSIATRNAMLYSAMQNEAQHDGLTGLYNRRHFLQRIRQDFVKAAKSSFTVAVFSLDDFRLYNELYGSHEGDRLLQDFSKMLLLAAGNQGVVGRYSGKEFVMAVPFQDAAAVQGMVDVVRDLLKDYLRRRREEGHRFLTFSAGICSYPAAAGNMDEAIQFASIATYAAKKNGKNRTQLYRDGQQFIQATPEALRFGEQCAQTIYALTAAVDAKDHYTFNHSENVSLYASKLAEEIGLDREHVEIVRQAGLLHDIGKIGVPEHILSKKGPLTREEMQIMQGHVEGSIAMIKYLPSLDYVIPAAIGHHERWDGNGYPRGLAGEEIPVGARCLCVADAFDAMTTKRSYKQALSVEAALDELRRNLGVQFDPRIGLAFIKMVEEGKISLPRRDTASAPDA